MAAEGPSKEQLRAEEKGNEWVAKGEARLKVFSFFSSNSKYEEAAEMFDKAAAQYKVAKLWDKAGAAYVRAGEMSEKIKQEHEAATFFLNAAKAYKNSSPKESTRWFKTAVDMHMENNRFATAAKIHKEIAEIEEKAMNMKDAIKAYKDAADCYSAEDAGTSQNQMLLKVAELSAGEEDFKTAIEIYEKVARNCLESNLLKWSVKDYLFKAGLCQLVVAAKQGDMKTCEDALEKYKDMNPGFEGSREEKFLTDCAGAFKADDVEAFTGHVHKYDSLVRLDNWTATLLLEVKNILKNGSDAAKGEPDLT